MNLFDKFELLDEEVPADAKLDKAQIAKLRRVYKVSSLESLLTLLTEFDRKHPAGDFLFRGVSDVNHALVPSALRRNVERISPIYRHFGFMAKYGSIHTTNGFSEEEEITALAAFYEHADRSGLVLPELPEGWHRCFANSRNPIAMFEFKEITKNNTLFPTWELVPLMQLAQHYGVPTRLLDWSFNINSGLYFAVSGIIASASLALRRKTSLEARRYFEDKTISLWIVNRWLVQSASRLGRTDTKGMQINIVEYPASRNNNLRAQKGCFTIVTGEQTVEQLTDMHRQSRELPHDIAFRDWFEELYPSFSFEISTLPAVFTRLDIPAIFSIELMQILSNCGYDYSTIYPGYTGCAVAAIESLNTTVLDAILHPINVD